MTEYYISHSGDDYANDGLSVANAFRSFGRANQVAGSASGDAVNFVNDQIWKPEVVATAYGDLVYTSGTTFTFTDAGSNFTSATIDTSVHCLHVNYSNKWYCFRIISITSTTQLTCSCGSGGLPSGLSGYKNVTVGDMPFALEVLRAGSPSTNKWFTIKSADESSPATIQTQQSAVNTAYSIFVILAESNYTRIHNLKMDLSKFSLYVSSGRYGTAVRAGDNFSTPFFCMVDNCEIWGDVSAAQGDNGILGLYSGWRALGYIAFDNHIHDLNGGIWGVGSSSIITPHIITHNRIHDIVCEDYWANAIACIQGSDGSVISNNAIWNVIASSSDHPTRGINVQDKNTIVINNTVYDTTAPSNGDGRSISVTTNASGSVVMNNIIHTAQKGLVIEDAVIHADYNCLYNCDSTYCEDAVAGEHDLSANPRFRDAANGDLLPLNGQLWSGGVHGERIGRVLPVRHLGQKQRSAGSPIGVY